MEEPEMKPKEDVRLPSPSGRRLPGPGSSRPAAPGPRSRRSRGAASGLLASGLGLLLAGCTIPLPQAQPDLTRYFILQQDVRPAGGAEHGSLPVVRLQAVDVPAYLSDRPLAVRRGSNEIHYLETARWGEPLDQGLERNLRLGLGALPGLTIVSRYDTLGTWQYSLKVRVTACEGTADGHVLFAADWVLEPAPKSDLPRKAGTFTGRDLAWDGKSPDSLVAALSQGVTQLCDALGAALQPPG
jgi:uncharacterized lipoprotein YmbA